ncbi:MULTISPECIES: alpha-amylase family protein [Chelativorans]|jgi:maltose alpha-D-glucosyltransferase/alpha-amylase|uniref:Alpha-amylase n=1 Tax=Chelativorans sp. (strain BNC1) TaxID=266779 RepID=Q11C21_CHESB|nr:MULTISPECIES: alpha-amylase family protein [Chelativorans]
MKDYWWKDAIVYAVDVERFCDSDGDGVGDFKGLTSKLDYIAELGVTCIWLLPFYPSTGEDNGYSITDYLRVDSRFGLFQDFLEFIHRAGEHGIRVVVDLVVHHTSNQHPWFQAARHNEKSRYRDFYIWTHNPPPTPPGKGTIFPGEEGTVWTYDEVARAYYHHRFYHFEPGLNHANPDVRDEIGRIIDYWLSFGVAGFRVDAASHILENPLAKSGEDENAPDMLREMFHRATGSKSDIVMLGEVDESPNELERFFDGTRLNMMFNFLLNNYLILGLAKEKAEPIQRGLAMLPVPPENGQWANFLRNFDEADLERLTPEELESVLKIFAPKEEMRIYGRGLRRRLAPMLDGDVRRLKMAMSLLYSMPGAPVLVYGDEIGMGEDLTQEGRNSVRSPMQWDGSRNAGFSSARKERMVQPIIDKGRFAFERINAETQRNDPASLLSFVKQLAILRRERTEIGSGFCAFLECGSDHVLAHHYKSEAAPLVMVHNLAGEAVKIDVKLPAGVTSLGTLFGGEMPSIEDGHLRMSLEPYGVRWLGLPR